MQAPAEEDAVSSCSHEVLTMMADRLRWGAEGARALACASHAMYAAVHCCDRRPGAPLVSFTDDQHVEWLYGLVPCGGGDDADFRCVDGVCRHAMCGFGADAWLAALRAVHLGMRAAPSRGVLSTGDVTLELELEIVHRLLGRIDGLVGLRLGSPMAQGERRVLRGPTAHAARVTAFERHLDLALGLPDLEILDVSHTPMGEMIELGMRPTAAVVTRPNPLIRVLSALTELRVLSMRASDARLTKELFESIVALPCLRTLHIGGNAPMAIDRRRAYARDDPTAVDLLNALPRLTDLDVSDVFPSITQDVVDAIARMPRLERLDVSTSSRGGIAGFGDVGGERATGALVRTLHGLRHLRAVKMEGRTGLLPILVRRALARDVQVASGAGTELWPAEADGGCAYDFWSDLPEHPDAPVGLLGGVERAVDWDAGVWPTR